MKNANSDTLDQLDHVRLAWNCERLLSKRQLAGKSGAKLYLVDVKIDSFDGPAILKVSVDDLTNESALQARALELSPDFGSSHFPRVLRCEKFNGWSALLMSVAGSGLLFTSQFSTINQPPSQLLAAQNIISQILDHWNKNAKIPYPCLSMLADTTIPEDVDPDELLGSSRQLIVFDTSSLGIVHPAIAEEVLAQILARKGGPAAWRARLPDFCVEFILAVGKSPEAYGEGVAEILGQLFVERSIWDNTNQPRLFSNLIETIQTIEGQRRVLETLCRTFPSNAHFWNHLGRHLNLRILGAVRGVREVFHRSNCIGAQ